MKLKFKTLNDKAVVPSRSHDTDVGYDLTAVSRNIVDKGKFGYYEYCTGIAISLPKGYGGFIFPRSSISEKGLILTNSVGVVDPGYHGEIKCRFKHIKDTADYDIGDRVAQLVIIKTEDVEFERVEDLGKSDRGDKGFGSSNTVQPIN